MVLIVKRRAAKIDEVDVWTEEHSSELGRPGGQSARRGNVAVVRKGLVCVIEQQDVLRLQVGVNEVQIVQEGDGAEELACKCLDVGSGKGNEASALEEIEYRQSEKGRNYADVASPVEALPKLNAAIAVMVVCSTQRVEYSKFDATSIAVLNDLSVRRARRASWSGEEAYLGHGSDDFHGNLFLIAVVNCPNDFAKCALTKE